MNPRLLNLGASVSLVALIVLCVAWEAWLAPLRPGGSTLVLKVLPLMAALFGILRGKRYTHQWSTLLSLLYLAEGLVRATSGRGPSLPLAWAEVALSSAFFLACMLYARATRPSLQKGS
ncbi:MAG: DUF2069 domain-containing protein [Rhodocyclaceae bacterium]|nr:DUF2069 domain-containing protein [Rhodocyclaceae bacterium]